MQLSFMRSEFKALIFLAFPILCTQLLQLGLGTADIAITGHFDTKVQAAVALGVSVWHPILLFTVGTLMSLAIFSAHHYGAGELEKVPVVFHAGLRLVAFFSILAIVLMWYSEGIFRLFSVDEGLIDPAVRYLRALSLGAPAIFLFNSLRSVSEGVARPVPVTLVMLVGFIVNACLNYVLVNGYAPIGLPSLAEVGSGLGTAATFWVMLGCMALFYKVDPRLAKFNLFRKPQGSVGLMLKDMAKVGFPNGATIFAEVTIFAVSGLILGRFGELVVSGHQISLNITSMSFMVPLSVSFALTALVGQKMGRKDLVGAVRVARMGRVTSLGIMVLTCLFLFAARNHLPLVFTTNPEIIALSAHLLLFSIVFQFPDVLQVAANGALRGMKDTRVPMLMSITSYWVVGMPLGYYLSVYQNMQAEGVWIGLIVGLSCSAILLNTRLQKLFKRFLAA